MTGTEQWMVGHVDSLMAVFVVVSYSKHHGSGCRGDVDVVEPLLLGELGEKR